MEHNRSVPARVNPLVVGIVVAVAASLVFGLIAWAALGDGPVPQWDRQVALAMKDASPTLAWLRGLMVLFSIVGGIAALTGLALVLFAWQWYRGRRIVAAACLWIPLSGGLADFLMKEIFNRERPPEEWRDPAVHEKNESFPSGHSMGSMIGFGMLAYVLGLETRARRLRWAAYAASGLIILLVGFSRIFLRAHWVSDVAGGFTIGVAWLGLCLGILEHWRRKVSPKGDAGV
ncbi:MAG: phosphatase PAP2 family protein [Gemmataceae bacterium]|nr:phosphatase PAP2 family protein [Gemmataceae bacterium]